MSRFCGYHEYRWEDQFETNFSELSPSTGSIEHPQVSLGPFLIWAKMGVALLTRMAPKNVVQWLNTFLWVLGNFLATFHPTLIICKLAAFFNNNHCTPTIYRFVVWKYNFTAQSLSTLLTLDSTDAKWAVHL